jgi:hypothetical protein
MLIEYAEKRISDERTLRNDMPVAEAAEKRRA